MTDEEVIKDYWKWEKEMKSKITQAHTDGYNRGFAKAEEKIADIKANCDLAIEGRDVKIKELELELTVEKDQHQEEINLHLHAEDYIKSLEQQIEKMKCCENCKHKKSEVDRCELLMYTMNACLCKNKDKWEIKENEL